MTPNEKIASVLNNIKNESEISPNSKRIEFRFNDHVVGFGIVAGEDERKILLKLQKEKVIKIELMPYHKDNIYKLHYKLEEFIFRADKVMVEIRDNFYSYYEKYKIFLDSQEEINYWNLVNPFWLVWQAILSFKNFLKLVWKHRITKIISLVVAVLALAAAIITLLTSDYSKIGDNLNNFKALIEIYGK